jgi:serine O-acetyltransferase
VVLGANATVLGPVTIGDGAVIGAQALVFKDVPAGARVLAPAAPIRSPLAAVQPLPKAGPKAGPKAA